MAAGAGTGRMPWAHFMVPDPTLRGDETVFSMPAISTRTKAPMMSAMESMAPTSWKWTSSGVVPWTFASASARSRKAAALLSFTRGERGLASMMARTSESPRWG